MNCTLCPRECGIDRRFYVGFCGAPKDAAVAKIMLHKWEEPCICFGNGSGAVFFSGCQLKCVFCQNHQISEKIQGNIHNIDSLCDTFLFLQEKGACNINLVSPTPYLPTIIPALEKAKAKGLQLPIVYNSGGYEKTDSLRLLDGLVDIYLPDFKFFDSKIANSFAGAVNYPKFAMEAITEMQRQTGKPTWENDHLLRGTIVRHLILPGHAKDSEDILSALSSVFAEDDILISLLRQYTPLRKTAQFPELLRPITSLEYSRVVRFAEEKRFRYIYTQKKESSSKEFIPDFSRYFEDFS